MLAHNAEPGSTVEVDRSEDGGGEDGTEPDVRITITKPARKREAVGVGGGAPAQAAARS